VGCIQHEHQITEEIRARAAVESSEGRSQERGNPEKEGRVVIERENQAAEVTHCASRHQARAGLALGRVVEDLQTKKAAVLRPQGKDQAGRVGTSTTDRNHQQGGRALKWTERY